MWFNDFSPKASCTRSNICARYVEYQKAKNGEKLIESEMQKRLLVEFGPYDFVNILLNNNKI